MRMHCPNMRRRRVAICPGPARHYAGVTWHVGKRAWIGQDHNSYMSSVCDTEKEAAFALSRHLGCNMDSLKRSEPHVHSRKGYAARFNQIVRAYAKAEKKLTD